MVNQWLRAVPVDLRARSGISLPPFETPVAQNPRSGPIVQARPGIFLTVQGRHRLLLVRGAQRTFCNVRDNDCDDGSGRRRDFPRSCVRGYPLAGVTAAAACVASFQVARSENFNQFGRASEVGGCAMRNRDLVSDGFLALTAGGMALLCSSLLAFAFV